jgi:hypothetical protein
MAGKTAVGALPNEAIPAGKPRTPAPTMLLITLKTSLGMDASPGGMILSLSSLLQLRCRRWSLLLIRVMDLLLLEGLLMTVAMGRGGGGGRVAPPRSVLRSVANCCADCDREEVASRSFRLG